MGLVRLTPCQAEKSTVSESLRGRLLTESRRGSIYNLVSLYWYNLYCEAFEMSCDLVSFPFFGAFAPCSDKQLKKKHKNIKHSDELSLLRALRAGQRLKSSPSSAIGGGAGLGKGAQGRAGQEQPQAPPGMPWAAVFWLEALQ